MLGKVNLIFLLFLISTVVWALPMSSTCSPSEDPLVERAWKLVDEGRFNSAMALAEKLIASNVLDGYLLKARIEFQQGHRGEALDILLLAQKRFPNAPRVYLTLGRLYAIQALSGNPKATEPAKEYLNKAIELDSSCLPAAVTLANLCYGIGDKACFEQWLDYSLQIDKEHPKVVELKARELYDKGRYAELRDYLESKRQLVAKNTSLKELLFKAYYHTQEYVEARKLLQELLAEEPDNMELYFIMGKMYGRSRALDVEKYILNNSLLKGKDLYLALAFFWEGVGDTDMALRYYDKAIEIDPSDPHLYETVGTYLISNSKYNEAITYLSKLVKLEPSSYKSHFLLGMAYRHAGYPNQAIEELERAKQLNPEYPHTYIELGNAYWDIAFKLFEDYKQEGFYWFDKGVEVMKEGLRNVKDERYKARFEKSIRDAAKTRRKIEKELKEHMLKSSGGYQ